MEWKRKDRQSLKVRISGRAIKDEGELTAYELITEDVTKQRELESPPPTSGQ